MSGLLNLGYQGRRITLQDLGRLMGQREQFGQGLRLALSSRGPDYYGAERERMSGEIGHEDQIRQAAANIRRAREEQDKAKTEALERERRLQSFEAGKAQFTQAQANERARLAREAANAREQARLNAAANKEPKALSPSEQRAADENARLAAESDFFSKFGGSYEAPRPFGDYTSPVGTDETQPQGYAEALGAINAKPSAIWRSSEKQATQEARAARGEARQDARLGLSREAAKRAAEGAKAAVTRAEQNKKDREEAAVYSAARRSWAMIARDVQRDLQDPISALSRANRANPLTSQQINDEIARRYRVSFPGEPLPSELKKPAGWVPPPDETGAPGPGGSGNPFLDAASAARGAVGSAPADAYVPPEVPEGVPFGPNAPDLTTAAPAAMPPNPFLAAAEAGANGGPGGPGSRGGSGAPAPGTVTNASFGGRPWTPADTPLYETRNFIADLLGRQQAERERVSTTPPAPRDALSNRGAVLAAQAMPDLPAYAQVASPTVAAQYPPRAEPFVASGNDAEIGAPASAGPAYVEDAATGRRVTAENVKPAPSPHEVAVAIIAAKSPVGRKMALEEIRLHPQEAIRRGLDYNDLMAQFAGK